MEATIIRQVIEQLKELPDELQKRVLEYTQSLAQAQLHGISGKQLLKFGGTIPSDELEMMKEAIEQGCERIDSNEW